MNPTTYRKNFDQSTNLNWHHIMNQHPDRDTSSLSEAFRDHVATWLAISPQSICSFEEVDLGTAITRWIPGNNQADDPRTQKSNYFRWPNPFGSKGPVRFDGYTHHGAQGIMINADLRDEELLKAIARQCFHIYQDARRGASWRKTANRADVQAEASAFVRSKADEIRLFLQHREVAKKQGVI